MVSTDDIIVMSKDMTATPYDAGDSLTLAQGPGTDPNIVQCIDKSLPLHLTWRAPSGGTVISRCRTQSQQCVV